MNEGTVKSDIQTLRRGVFKKKNLEGLLEEHENIFQKTKVLMKFII